MPLSKAKVQRSRDPSKVPNKLRVGQLGMPRAVSKYRKSIALLTPPRNKNHTREEGLKRKARNV